MAKSVGRTLGLITGGRYDTVEVRENDLAISVYSKQKGEMIPVEQVFSSLSKGTLSQLYLARGRYQDAIQYQKAALPLIPGAENSRNFAYLAQVYFRGGNFRSADRALKKALESIAQEGATP